MISDGPMSMCVKLLKFRGVQVGRSLEATASCVVYVSWYSACVSIGHSYCRSTCGNYRVILLVAVFKLPLSYRTCIKRLILCGILTVLGSGRRCVVWCVN